MRKLKIDQGFFVMAFERDVDYEVYSPQSAYLDLVTADVEWHYEEDDDAAMAGLGAAENRTQRERIEAEPNRFLLIPGLSHGEHHDILRGFLTSGWTDDEDLRDVAREAYFGSIGGWKKAIEDEGVIRAYYAFRDRKMIELAQEFLLDNGVKVDWM